MGFTPGRISIPPDADAIRENAFAAYKRKRDEVAQRSFKNPLSRRRTIVKDSLKALARSMQQQLAQHSTLPLPEELPRAYQAVLEPLVSFDEIRTARRRVEHALPVFMRIVKRIQQKLSSPHVQSVDEIERFRREAIGRLTDFLGELEEPITQLRAYARVLKSLPMLDEHTPLVLLAGLPNAGKTWLYNQLTGSDAREGAYAFTTQRLNATPLQLSSGKRVLLVDTPGLLPREEKNEIERIALALLPFAHAIILVVDPSQPREDQETVQAFITRHTHAPILVFVNDKGYGHLWHPKGVSTLDALREELETLLTKENENTRDAKD